MIPRSLPPCLPSAALPSPARLYHHGLAAYSSRPACHCSFQTLRVKPAARPFHSSRRLFQDGALVASSQNHYETLNVPYSANVTDIKKCALSRLYPNTMR